MNGGSDLPQLCFYFVFLAVLFCELTQPIKIKQNCDTVHIML